jgi:hypothetical protein
MKSANLINIIKKEEMDHINEKDIIKQPTSWGTNTIKDDPKA